MVFLSCIITGKGHWTFQECFIQTSQREFHLEDRTSSLIFKNFAFHSLEQKASAMPKRNYPDVLVFSPEHTSSYLFKRNLQEVKCLTQEVLYNLLLDRSSLNVKLCYQHSTCTALQLKTVMGNAGSRNRVQSFKKAELASTAPQPHSSSSCPPPVIQAVPANPECCFPFLEINLT